MKESDYNIHPEGKKTLIGVGVMNVIIVFLQLNEGSFLGGFELPLKLILISLSILCIYRGITLHEVLKITEEGIELSKNNMKLSASWGQFSIVEDDLISFIIKIEKKQYRFAKKHLPLEVLELLKERTKNRSSLHTPALSRSALQG